jgi:hypothetical protein
MLPDQSLLTDNCCKGTTGEADVCKQGAGNWYAVTGGAAVLFGYASI